MQRNIFDNDNGVVNHKADGRRQSTQSHQVEALAQHFSAINVATTVTGMTSAATSEVPQSRRNKTMMMMPESAR